LEATEANGCCVTGGSGVLKFKALDHWVAIPAFAAAGMVVVGAVEGKVGLPVPTFPVLPSLVGFVTCG
jgi:hypothetical protein